MPHPIYHALVGMLSILVVYAFWGLYKGIHYLYKNPSKIKNLLFKIKEHFTCFFRAIRKREDSPTLGETVQNNLQDGGKIHVWSQVNCSVYKLSEKIASIEENQTFTFSLIRGRHRLVFYAVQEGKILIHTHVFEIPESQYEDFYDLFLEDLVPSGSSLEYDTNNVGNLIIRGLRTENDDMGAHNLLVTDNDSLTVLDIPTEDHFNNIFGEVTSIGSTAFLGKENLISITIPNSITEIGDSAFMFCEKLTSIKIPDTVAEIGDCMFWGCYSLRSITIPESVKSIKWRSFYGCHSLKELHIHSNIENIKAGAFERCWNLSVITVDPGNNNYDSRYCCNAIIDSRSEELVLGCKSSHIPSDIRTIGPYAFAGQTELKSMVIPNSIKEIKEYAFYGCSELESIKLSSSLLKIGEGAFSACSKLFQPSLPTKLKSIGDYAFNGCEKITSITITASISEIGANPWTNCKIELINVDESNKSYYSENNCLIRACDKCLIIAGKKAIIPITIQHIGEKALFNYQNGVSISIPASVKSIGKNGLSEHLHFIYFNNIECKIDPSVLSTPSNTKIIVPPGGKNHYYKTFKNKNWITIQEALVVNDEDVIFEKGVIEEDFHYYEIKYNPSKTVIKEAHFFQDGPCCGCFYRITEGVKYLCDDSFSRYELWGITLPDSLVMIGREAFRNSSIKELIIPRNVTHIGDYAFPDLNRIVFLGLPLMIGDNALGISSDIVIVVPIGSKSLFETLFEKGRHQIDYSKCIIEEK